MGKKNALIHEIDSGSISVETISDRESQSKENTLNAFESGNLVDGSEVEACRTEFGRTVKNDQTQTKIASEWMTQQDLEEKTATAFRDKQVIQGSLIFVELILHKSLKAQGLADTGVQTTVIDRRITPVAIYSPRNIIVQTKHPSKKFHRRGGLIVRVLCGTIKSTFPTKLKN